MSSRKNAAHALGEFVKDQPITPGDLSSTIYTQAHSCHGGWRSSLRFWQPTIDRMMRYIRLESEPLDIAWINETQIVASCVDGQVRVVDSENVKVLQTIPAIKGWAYAIAAHPNDGTIAIAGNDGQLGRVRLDKPDK